MTQKDLTDEEWNEIAWLLPEQDRGRPRTRDREILNAILYVLSTGCRWSELPNRFPPKSTVHHRFQVWSKSGFFDKVLRYCRRFLPQSEIHHLDSSLKKAKKGATLLLEAG